MGNLLGWLVVLGIGVPFSIAWHELGHLIPAKKFGVACTQYMVGFGNTLWSRKIGETEYGIKAIPFGGYVRMVGMLPPAPGRAVGADTTGRFGALMDAARDDAQRQIRPGDENRLFYQRSVPKRLVIMLGGPLMNLILATFLLTVLLTGYGISTPTTTVAEISKCVIPVATDPATKTRTTCSASDPASPAAAAGLLPGDQIVSFAGVPVKSWDDVRDRIRSNRGTPVEMEVVRSGERKTLTVTPMEDTRYALDADGKLVKGEDGQYLTEKVGFLGVTPDSEMVRQPITAVPGFVGTTVAGTAGVVLNIPEKMVGVTKAAFGSGERDPQGPIGLVGVGRLAGEMGSIEGTAAHPITWTDRFAMWISMIASLNIALFVFNLIPLPPLDGGQAAGALWEGTKRTFARFTGRPDPGPVDVAKALPLAYAVASAFVLMSVILLYADIVNPIRLGG